MKMPPYTKISRISINDNVRLGVGYVIYRDKKIDLELRFN
jgi:hypothetical protein